MLRVVLCAAAAAASASKVSCFASSGIGASRCSERDKPRIAKHSNRRHGGRAMSDAANVGPRRCPASIDRLAMSAQQRGSLYTRGGAVGDAGVKQHKLATESRQEPHGRATRRGGLADRDPEVFEIIRAERERQVGPLESWTDTAGL